MGFHKCLREKLVLPVARVEWVWWRLRCWLIAKGREWAEDEFNSIDDGGTGGDWHTWDMTNWEFVTWRQSILDRHYTRLADRLSVPLPLRAKGNCLTTGGEMLYNTAAIAAIRRGIRAERIERKRLWESLLVGSVGGVGVYLCGLLVQAFFRRG